jgi:hypothetical protein
MTDDVKRIKLKYPIPVPKKGGGEVMVDELTIGRLKAKHLRALPSGFGTEGSTLDAVVMIPLIAGLAELPESSIDEMDLGDLLIVAEELGDFLGVSPQIGKKPSGE